MNFLNKQLGFCLNKMDIILNDMQHSIIFIFASVIFRFYSNPILFFYYQLSNSLN